MEIVSQYVCHSLIFLFFSVYLKEKETNAVHMNVQRGSYFEMTLPWIVDKDGYTTKINGQLFHVDASTSLQVNSRCNFCLCDFRA